MVFYNDCQHLNFVGIDINLEVILIQYCFGPNIYKIYGALLIFEECHVLTVFSGANEGVQRGRSKKGTESKGDEERAKRRNMKRNWRERKGRGARLGEDTLERIWDLVLQSSMWYYRLSLKDLRAEFRVLPDKTEVVLFMLSIKMVNWYHLDYCCCVLSANINSLRITL